MADVPGDHDPRPAPPWGEICIATFSNVELPIPLLNGPVYAGLSPLAFKAMIKLMAFAWHQTPAGSLPMDAHTLAENSGFGRDVSGWLEIEAEVTGRWLACNDDRLYLPEWGKTIEAAGERKTGIKKSDTRRQRRTALRKALTEAGVPNVKGITVARIDEVVEAFCNRGGLEMRGGARSDLVVTLASDFGLLPKELGADVRLASKFRSLGTVVSGSG